MSGPDKPRRGRRILGPDERRLWERIARTADPLSGQKPKGDIVDVPDMPLQDTPAQAFRREDTHKPQAGRAPRIPGHLVRPTGPQAGPAHRVTTFGPEVGPVGRPEAGLDRRTSDRLRKGSREPDARIDLHGMTAERAHRACLTFLADAVARGCRVVLVITGKGGRRDDSDFMTPGRGVLRESLPGWLRASPLGHSIVGIYQAHQKHGGSGAFYVYLKRNR